MTPAIPPASKWPFEERPGVPLNPHKNGWHWLSGPNGVPACHHWNAGKGTWWIIDCAHSADVISNAAINYIAPCLTPTEQAAAVAQARADAVPDGYVLAPRSPTVRLHHEAAKAVHIDRKGFEAMWFSITNYLVRQPTPSTELGHGD